MEEGYLDYTYYIITDRYYVSKELPSLYDSSGGFLENLGERISSGTFTAEIEKQNLLSDVTLLNLIDYLDKNSSLEGSVSKVKIIINEYVKEYRGNKSYLNNILLSAWEKKHFGYSEVNNKDIFSSLGQFFKDSAWVYETDDGGKIVGWRPGKNSIIGTLLYAIFIVQSIMLFISYMKRFFYIIILSLFAPLVIIFDFLTKTIS